MKIQVSNRDFGFFSSQPITVYRVENDDDDTIVWCNHWGATVEDVEDYYGHVTTQEFCDKCGAWRQVATDDNWHDTPFEGEV